MKHDGLPQGFDTRAIHAGQYPDPATGAGVTPIYATSTYVQDGPGIHKGFDYARSQNPTRFAFERAVAALEGGTHGFAFASGMAAATAILHVLDHGAHIVTTDDLYGGTYRLFEQVYKRAAGLRVTYADLTDPANLMHALQPDTRMIWIETPSNPLLKLVDLAALAFMARQRGILTVVDNTFASPWLQRPIEHGIDIVFHSATKYISGHSDVIGGVVTTAQPELAEKIGFLQNSTGGIAGPFDSFLMHRGLKTLGLRMQRHCENAAWLAAWLETHPAVERVIYPGLKSHPQHALARKQMRMGGGMISFQVKGGKPAATRVVKGTKIIALAVSLGGVESLIEHPATMSHVSIPPEVRARTGIQDGLIRLSVGIEDIRDLQADLAAALQE